MSPLRGAPAALEDVPILAEAVMPLRRARLCASCETVFDQTWRTCPACTSAEIVSLAAWLGTTTNGGAA